MGASLTFTFVVLTTLLVWFSLKWDSLKALQSKTSYVEIGVGIAIVAGNFLRNLVGRQGFGLVDMLVTFVGLALAFYGTRAFRFFLLPSAYILILIVGYRLENTVQDLSGLEAWQAGIMVSLMSSLGIGASLSGNTVALNGASTIFLQIQGPCTGIKGVLAFGTLASMAVLDLKASRTKIALVLALGFIGTFLVNILRLGTIFLETYYLGVDTGLKMHTYLGYALFIVWVLIFWSAAFRFLIPKSDRRRNQESLHSGPLENSKRTPSIGLFKAALREP
jgi:exosortase/archaeosortase family protein